MISYTELDEEWGQVNTDTQTNIKNDLARVHEANGIGNLAGLKNVYRC